MEFPILKIYTKNGKTRFWKIRIQKKNSHYLIQREYGIENGKITRPTPLSINDEKKAMTKAKALFKKKIEEGFREEEHKNLKMYHTKQSVIRPMGAHKLDDFSYKLKYPVLVQRKLDGYRCLAHWDSSSQSVHLYSRTMKLYSHLDHIREELKQLKDFMKGDFYIDGELYNHEMRLHEIGSLVRKKYVDNENIKKMKEIQYFIFDMFRPDQMNLTFVERYQLLEKIFTYKKFQYLHLVSIVECKNLKCVEKENEKYLSEGYEGVIVRNKDGLYEWNKKSYDVLRTKEFKREKFLLIGAKEGEGAQKGAIVWKVKCNQEPTYQQSKILAKTKSHDHSFWAIPIGTIEERRILYEKYSKNPKKYIGQTVVVKYLEKDVNGCVTRNPIMEKFV